MPELPTWFFCVGAQKAGTTWLYDYCAKHPEIHVPSVKEAHYFDVLHDAKHSGFANNRAEALAKYKPLTKLMSSLRRSRQPGDDSSKETLQALVAMHEDTSAEHLAYQAFVNRGRTTEKVVADITPDYSVLNRPAFEDMASMPGAPKFLFIMRDPMERTWSNIKMHRAFLKARKNIVLDEMDIVNRLVQGRQKHILQRSMYQQTLFNLKRSVPADQLLVLFYESLFSEASIRQFCDFLEVSFVAGDYETIVRRGKTQGIPDEAFDKLAPMLRVVYQRISENFADVVPSNWHTDRVLTQQRPQAAT
ncbi:sulfotransferase [Shimia sp. Alg240-R146]|uniref:sulfotransferase n=1 Tax=Shimia sp. Alg240-R146 TaxID=2993449 RepID=UPI0022E5679C|nr:sulfotransferase [Shimia sp. Alg240-R146]